MQTISVCLPFRILFPIPDRSKAAQQQQAAPSVETYYQVLLYSHGACSMYTCTVSLSNRRRAHNSIEFRNFAFFHFSSTTSEPRVAGFGIGKAATAVAQRTAWLQQRVIPLIMQVTTCTPVAQSPTMYTDIALLGGFPASSITTGSRLFAAREIKTHHRKKLLQLLLLLQARLQTSFTTR